MGGPLHETECGTVRYLTIGRSTRKVKVLVSVVSRAVPFRLDPLEAALIILPIGVEWASPIGQREVTRLLGV